MREKKTRREGEKSSITLSVFLLPLLSVVDGRCRALIAFTSEENGWSVEAKRAANIKEEKEKKKMKKGNCSKYTNQNGESYLPVTPC